MKLLKKQCPQTDIANRTNRIQFLEALQLDNLEEVDELREQLQIVEAVLVLREFDKNQTFDPATITGGTGFNHCSFGAQKY